MDKEKFEVHTMYTSKMLIDKVKYESQGIHLHRLIHHRFIWFWSKLWSMWKANCDVYYLPKMEKMDTVFLKIFKKKKIFIASVEGVVGEQIVKDNVEAEKYYREMNSVFSISQCIQQSVEVIWNMKTPVLYLGVDTPTTNPHKKSQIKTIIWIGSLIERKRPQYLLECAKAFPNINFIMIGDGDLSVSIENSILNDGIKNVKMTGRIPNQKVYEYLAESDLLIMTSDKEGLPKVIGEAMLMNVPSVYINECYKVDYIQNGVNGFAVQSLEQMIEQIQYLISHPIEYSKISAAAGISALNYTWDKLIPQYEDYFTKVYYSHGKKKIK